MSSKNLTPYSRVHATSTKEKLLDPKTYKVKKGVEVVGFVTKNHGSSIVKKHKSRKGRTYYSLVGSTHNLSKKTQAAIAFQLDQPSVDKSILFVDHTKENNGI